MAPASTSPDRSTVSTSSRASAAAQSQYFAGASTKRLTIQGADTLPSWSSGHDASTRPVRIEDRDSRPRATRKAPAKRLARWSSWTGAAAVMIAMRNIASVTTRNRV